MSPKPIETLVVIGVGLIGGSFALALRRAGAVRRVVGVGRSRANLEQALAAGVIDEIGASAAEAVTSADLVLLAVPVGQTGRVMAQIEPCLGPGTVLTDAGSTKQDVVALARAYLPRHLPRFVPAHPIAGLEKSGVTAAVADLYRERTVVVTPLAETDAAATAKVKALWQACGARVVIMAPELHDEMLALVSHLPHLLAFALMDRVAAHPRAQALLDLAGTGFRDVTRIAASSPEMWRDICMANRESLLKQIDGYQAQLGAIRDLLANGDAAALEKIFSRARDTRKRLPNGTQ